MSRQFFFTKTILFLLVVTSCKKSETSITKKEVSKPVSKIQKQQDSVNYYSNPDYTYEYRTQEADGNYKYRYEVTGSDSNGNIVVGKVAVESKFGTGKITNASGKIIDVEVEWIAYGKLKATDEEGNEYQMDVKQ